MDSSHQTNWLSQFFYTFLICNIYSIWHLCTYILTQKKDNNIFAAELRYLNQQTGGLNKIKRWELYYMLTDNLPVKQWAIELVFRELNIEEQKVTHFFCIFHSLQTLKQKLGGPIYKKAYCHLTTAFYQQKTEAKVEKSNQNVIN